MHHRLLLILLIGALFLQSGREAVIGLWFWANQEQVAERHCINKDEPLLMCQGKCFLQKVIETEPPEDAAGTAKMPVPEERAPFYALPVSHLLKPGFSREELLGKSGFYYLPPHSVEWSLSLFRPPWV